MEKSASEMASGSSSSALAAAYQLCMQGVDKVLEGLTLGTASPECLPLLHARADVGFHSQVVRVCLLKLAQNLLNELLCQLPAH